MDASASSRTLSGEPGERRVLTAISWGALVIAAPTALALVVLFLVLELTSDGQTRLLGLALLSSGAISLTAATIVSQREMPGFVLACWCVFALTGLWALGAGVLFLAIEFDFDEGRSLALALGGAIYLALGLMTLIPASIVAVAYLVFHVAMRPRTQRP